MYSEIEKMNTVATEGKNSVMTAKIKVCISGLSENEGTQIKNEILDNRKLQIELLEDNTLHPACTHLLTKTNPQLVKTEKVLSALARGIPIIDIKYLKKFLNLNNQVKWNDPVFISHYDIGGKLIHIQCAFSPGCRTGKWDSAGLHFRGGGGVGRRLLKGYI